jgi:hypothetical protein
MHDLEARMDGADAKLDLLVALHGHHQLPHGSPGNGGVINLWRMRSFPLIIVYFPYLVNVMPLQL